MLQAIRGRAASWIVKILFVLLIVSFAAWGVADWVRSAATPSVVAEVGPVRIDPGVFQQAVAAEMQRFRQVLGPNFDRDQARQFGIGDRVIEQIVSDTLLELEARRLGVTVTDAELASTIRDNPAFRDPSGQFDRNRFEAVINRAGYSEQRFTEELRKQIARTQAVRPIMDGAEPPKAIIDAMLRYRGERRVAETFVVPPVAANKIAAPTDAQLEDYLKANNAKFMRPEYRTLSYVSLSPAALADKITVSEADAKEAYQGRLDEFTTAEQRTVEQLLLPDQAAADTASQDLADGADFAALAKSLGKSASDTSLGTVARAGLPDEFAEPIFALTAPGVTKPVKSPFGWTIFKVTAIKPGSVEPFESVKTKLIEEIKKEKAGDAVPDLANKLEDALAGGGELDAAAQKVDLAIQKTPPLDRRGQGIDGKPVAGLPAAGPQGNPLLSTAFGLTEGKTSSLIETSDDSYLAVRVDQITPAVLPPLADIKPAVTAAWTQAQRDTATKQRADALADKVKAGTDMTAAAREAGAELKTSPAFTRDGAGAQLPANIVTTLFGGAAGTVAVAETAEGYVVARLKEVQPVDPATADAQRTKLRDELRQALGSDLLQEFQTSLRNRYSVSINQRAVDLAL
jgi:peptidyl-prolyl cis-trans isomerase D